MSYRFPIFSLLDSLSPVSLGSVRVKSVTWLESWSVGWDGLRAISCFHTLDSGGLFTRARHHAPDSFLFRFAYSVLKVNVFMELQLSTRKGIELKRDSV